MGQVTVSVWSYPAASAFSDSGDYDVPGAALVALRPASAPNGPTPTATATPTPTAVATPTGIARRGTPTTKYQGSTASSITVNKPTGVVSGDVMLAFISTGTYDVGSYAIPSLSGWSTVGSTGWNFGASSYWPQIFILVRVADGTEGSSFGFTFTINADESSAAIVAYSGVNNSTPTDGYAAAYEQERPGCYQCDWLQHDG